MLIQVHHVFSSCNYISWNFHDLTNVVLLLRYSQISSLSIDQSKRKISLKSNKKAHLSICEPFSVENTVITFLNTKFLKKGVFRLVDEIILTGRHGSDPE